MLVFVISLRLLPVWVKKSDLGCLKMLNLFIKKLAPIRVVSDTFLESLIESITNSDIFTNSLNRLKKDKLVWINVKILNDDANMRKWFFFVRNYENLGVELFGRWSRLNIRVYLTDASIIGKTSKYWKVYAL